MVHPENLLFNFFWFRFYTFTNNPVITLHCCLAGLGSDKGKMEKCVPVLIKPCNSVKVTEA